ncbi:MAG: peptidoglycan DD-metalloendopeptidase family protein [Eubacterium sp.]|nr:peptidoglycan DD-metalloendopeptidase family protein [Eubacterium sp.]
MIKRNTKKTLSAVLIGAMIASATLQVVPEIAPKNDISSVFADELSDAQEKKEEASQKKKEAESKLSELNTAKADILDVIEQLDNEIFSYSSKISELKDQKNSLQVAAAINENILQDAYIAETNQYESMKDRIQFAYENGDAQYIEALLSIKDYSTVINQSEYVDKVSVYDQNQLNDLLEIEKTISGYKDIIANNIGEVNNLKAEAEGEQEALEVMQVGKQEKLSEYNVEISDTEYTIEQMEAIEAEQDAQIAAIEAAAAAARAAAEKAAAEKAAKASTPKPVQTASGTDAEEDNGDDSDDSDTPSSMNSYGGGAFTWPLPGYYSIGSGFGPRVAPTAGASTFHKGVDIGCPEGTTIVAAADGVVSYTGYFGGGGNTVIIDHGNGLSTLYMHMSAFGISEGANVTAGTAIGYAGCTGVATGPHLHFAVRVGGEYVDPMGYL